ncbi:hypothetical protein GY45DRAFT_1329746 [Cubamyces sp. BRFM 1775]|nr:hypothetical protein GY45DRAFT_1329746 [Cubamyces sp. BRFM 1775]
MVCTDQWLVTHVDSSWSVSQLKHVLLEKFAKDSPGVDRKQRSIPVSPRKARRRSLSPITFAAPLRKPRLVAAESAAFNLGDEGDALDQPEVDDDSEDYEEDDDVNQVFADAHRYKYNTRPSTSSASDSLARLLPAEGSELTQETTAYILMTFSTTQILEDRFSLEWYGIHPGELLELHPLAHSFVSLPRYSLDAYITPYFSAKVWALRTTGNHLETIPRDAGGDHQVEDESDDVNLRSPLFRDKGKKKVGLEWKERWAVIHQGVFSLCKERHDHHSAYTAPLSSMLCIKDGSHLDLPSRSSRRTRSLPAQKLSPSPASEIVCLKFADPGPRQRTMSSESYLTYERPIQDADCPPPSGAWWRRGRDTHGSLSSSLASSASALIGSPSGTGLADMWDALARRGSRSGLEDLDGDENAVWIVLDMLSSAACSHILRVLHREGPSTCDSAFLPPRTPARSVPSPIVFSTRSSSPMSPSDVLTPGPASSYTFPPAPSSPLSSPDSVDFPSSSFSQTPNDAYPFPSSPEAVASAPPTRPVTPRRPPQLRIDPYATDHGVPYPDWRLSLVRRARRAGLGAVGRAMELVMFGDEEDDDEDLEDDLAIEWARRASAVEASPIEPLERPQSRPRAGRHVSDSAIPFSFAASPPGEFDSPHPEPGTLEDSDESENEWEGWLDVAIMHRRRERLAERPAIERTDTLDTAVPEGPYWSTDWNTTNGASPAASTPEREQASPWPPAHTRDQSGSEAEMEAETEGEDSSIHSHDPPLRPRPNSYYGYPQPAKSSSRGRHLKRAAALEHGGRTLSSYSSADSLLKRTIRTAIGSSAKAKRASGSASSSEANLDPSAEPPLPRSASASPPLLPPSLASMRSAARSRPLSPLCAQVQGNEDRRGSPRTHHPIPLPGMPMVPSGYTTFRHSALYGRNPRPSSARGSTPGVEEDEGNHAGLAHGQSMQRLPVPMSMMMTTVSSTVSVGTGKAHGGGASR